MTEEHWGHDVVAGEYAGHPGLLYEPRPTSIVALLDHAARFGGATFLVQGERRISFDEFRDAVARVATDLGARGVGPGERVLLVAHNGPAWVVALWATWVAGAVPVLGNRWWSEEELAAAMALAGPVLLITDLPQPPADVDVLTLRAVDELTAGGPQPHAGPPDVTSGPEGIGEDDEAMILFTSGSSGRAKGVRLSHRSLLANQHNLLLASGRLPHQQQDGAPRTISLVTVPLFHIGGVTHLLTQVIAGGCLVFLRGRFDPAEVLATIERERVTNWGGVPTMARRVLDHPDLARTDLSSLRAFPLGGAPVPETLLEQVRSQLPALSRGLATTWGLSESGGFLTIAKSKDLVDRPGTSGRPYPVVEVRVADPDPTGAGELLVRSPTVMLGYLGAEDDATVDADGWLHTGDVGRLDDGFVFLTGRAKDIVIRGGENIACPHVEEVVLRNADVSEVAVFGIPDEDLGEQLVAVVVPRAGATPTVASLREHAQRSLAYFELPAQWSIRQEPLPVLPTGKVDKRALRDAQLEGSGPPTDRSGGAAC